MKSSRRHDWYTHYEICKRNGNLAMADKYAANLRNKFKTADAELTKIDRRIRRIERERQTRR